MKTKYKVLLGLAGLTIIVLLVVLLAMMINEPGSSDEKNGEASEFSAPTDGDYSKYEADYDLMYDLVEYARMHPENVGLNQYVDNYLDHIDSMKGLLPIDYTLPDDPYNYYAISDGSVREDCPVFCVYIEATTPYMYDEALAELRRVSKYPLEDYVILKNILYMPIGEPDGG